MSELLLTGAFAYTEEQKERFARLGCRVHFMQQERECLPVDAERIELVVCNGLFLWHDIDEFTNLRYVQLTSAGLDRVPLEKIRGKGIVLHNARGVYSVPMAEWAVFRVLERYKQGHWFYERQRRKEWLKCRELRELAGRKVAVVGAGNVGQEVAKRFAAFGMKVVGYDIRVFESSCFDRIKLIETFGADVGSFDVIVVTAPLTEQTFHLISRDMLRRLKRDAVLVNIARGALVDEGALGETLAERPDVYAALDVFEQEPLPEGSPLWRLPNVALSPHNSFVSDGNVERMFSVIYNNLKNYLAEGV